MADTREQIAIRIPSEMAEDIRGIVKVLCDLDEYTNVTRWIMKQIEIGVDKAADRGLRWRALPPGEVRQGRPSFELNKQETT